MTCAPPLPELPAPQLPAPGAPSHTAINPTSSAATQTLAPTLLHALLYALPAFIALHTALNGDPDIWWHLRSGEWIAQHHAIPHTDIFSIGGLGKPWQAYSWLFELLVFALFHGFGFLGVVLYTAAAALAITVAVHSLVRQTQPDVSLAALLTLAACLSCAHLYTPRPWLLTILFFTLELQLLNKAQRTGQQIQLLWLPLIFLLWTNVHIQFVDGLLVLGLAWAESLFAHLRPHLAVTRFQLRTATLVLLASLLATLVNPYGWRIYRVAFELSAQPGVLNKIQELQAIPFRDLPDWCLLGLAMAAVAVFARSGRLFSFESALLPLAVYLAFRSQRDLWLLAITAAAILARWKPSPSNTRPANTHPSKLQPAPIPVWRTPASLALATLILLAYARTQHLDEHHLTARLGDSLPLRALAFVKAHGYSGPIYNDFNWGGYLIWALRQPVSIDGRAAFYGDEQIDRSLATWNGHPNWNQDPALQSANLIIGPAQAPLTQLLEFDTKVKLVYRDGLAAVFIRARR